MIATSKIEIDLNWYTRHKIEATQDDKYSRDVQITLVADSVPWEIPDGVTAVVNYVKPDGTGGEYDTMPNGETAWSASGNVLTVKLAPQVLTVAGMVHMGVTLILEHKAINTFQIAIDVHKNVATMLTESENYERVTAFIPMPDNAAEGQYIVVEKVDEIGKITKVRTEPSALPQLAELSQRVADLEYEPIDITSIRHGAGTVELGTVLDAVEVSWTLSKTPVAQTAGGAAVGVDDRSAVVPGPFSKTTAIAVTATDERGAEDRASTTVFFYNAVYYGVHNGTAMPTDAQLRALPRKIQPGLGLNLTGNAGVGQYLIYAAPSDYGTPEFWYDGLRAAFRKAGTMLHTNSSGRAENYDVWLSEADELGDVTITVK